MQYTENDLGPFLARFGMFILAAEAISSEFTNCAVVSNVGEPTAVLPDLVANLLLKLAPLCVRDFKSESNQVNQAIADKL